MSITPHRPQSLVTTEGLAPCLFSAGDSVRLKSPETLSRLNENLRASGRQAIPADGTEAITVTDVQPAERMGGGKCWLITGQIDGHEGRLSIVSFAEDVLAPAMSI